MNPNKLLFHPVYPYHSQNPDSESFQITPYQTQFPKNGLYFVVA
ncbi:hypothetical protein NIES19_10380 [Anabaena cylindrica PCC 7122]|nr:hypothetical protein NIES19_10380 [Anabaena cylindrica PCC 7122]